MATAMTWNDVLRFVKQWIESRIPGFLRLLDAISLARYGKKFLDLLLSNPKDAYNLVKEKYGGDEASADFVFVTLILKPIASKLGKLGLEYEMLRYVKEGDADKLRDLLRDFMDNNDKTSVSG